MLHTSARKFLLATCIAAVPSLALAQAQQSQPAQQQSAQRSASQMSGKFLAAPQSGQMRAADLREADIYTADNQKVGDIDDILLDSQGKIVAVVVGVGGFLGIGQKNVAIPFDALEIQDRNAAMASDRTETRSTASANRPANERMTTGAVPDNRAAGTDQDRQRTTAQRAEDVGQQQANRQAERATSQPPAQQRQSTTTTTTTTTMQQRTAQATTGMWKPERILLKGVTKADLQAAPEFKWDENEANRSRSGSSNAPARNR